MPDATPTLRGADGNLLYGLLALQMNFVDRDALLAAMQAWVFDKAKPLGQVLQEQGRLTPERRQASMCWPLVRKPGTPGAWAMRRKKPPSKMSRRELLVHVSEEAKRRRDAHEQRRAEEERERVEAERQELRELAEECRRLARDYYEGVEVPVGSFDEVQLSVRRLVERVQRHPDLQAEAAQGGLGALYRRAQQRAEDCRRPVAEKFDAYHRCAAADMTPDEDAEPG
jgi:hypothetical protein